MLPGVLMVNIAAVDVAFDGQALLILTLYRLLFNAGVTAVKVSVELFAPVISVYVFPLFEKFSTRLSVWGVAQWTGRGS